MRSLLGVVLAAPVLAALFLACGSSDKPPFAELSTDAAHQGDAAYDATLGADAAKARDSSPPPPTCRDGDGGAVFPGDPSRKCECAYAYGSSVTIMLPCGVTLCSEGKNEAAICGLNAILTVVPGCPDARVDDPAVPLCDAGSPNDAAADADAGNGS
ncbi:MAG TPA: hypothetical protein VLT33_01030 [Labilithrix sp.]|nr:hypothetical protein [Labilithrix sp.]